MVTFRKTERDIRDIRKNKLSFVLYNRIEVVLEEACMVGSELHTQLKPEQQKNHPIPSLQKRHTGLNHHSSTLLTKIKPVFFSGLCLLK